MPLLRIYITYVHLHGGTGQAHSLTESLGHRDFRHGKEVRPQIPVATSS